MLTKSSLKTFNQEKALVGAFSVIVKTGCGTDGALHSTSPGRYARVGPIMTKKYEHNNHLGYLHVIVGSICFCVETVHFILNMRLNRIHDQNIYFVTFFVT